MLPLRLPVVACAHRLVPRYLHLHLAPVDLLLLSSRRPLVLQNVLVVPQLAGVRQLQLLLQRLCQVQFQMSTFRILSRSALLC
jgi:hypothetical protein